MAPKRKLGNDGPLVSAIGYGAMGLEGYYGGKDNIKNPFLIMRSAPLSLVAGVLST